ncbi:MAG: HAD family hydrolase [Litorivicinaceae bacterium]
MTIQTETARVDWSDLADRFALVFDLDGTLVDSAENLRVAANQVFASYGIAALTRSDVIRHVADGQPLLIQRAVSEWGGSAAMGDALNTEFRALLASDPIAHMTLMPGSESFLTWAAGVDLPMAICTNKTESVAIETVHHLGIGHHFRAVIGAVSGRALKPHPEPLRLAIDTMTIGARQPVMIGDALADSEVAKAAGIPCILIEGGYTVDPVSALGATTTIPRIDRLGHGLVHLRQRG